MSIVIVGDGATGTAAALGIRQRNPHIPITIISDDQNPAYFRAALTNYLLGELSDRQLYAVPIDFYEVNNIRRIYAQVTGINTQNKHVILHMDNKEHSLPFQKLIIATGSRPFIPSSDHSILKVARTLRTLRDAQQYEEMLTEKSIQHAVIIGGGPLALEWLSAFARRGVRVTLLLRSKQSLMRKELNATARDLLISHIRMHATILFDEIASVQESNGILSSITLASKQTIKADFLGFATGVQANIEFLAHSNIRHSSKGIEVNQYLQTSHPDIYAGGDVAMIHNKPSLGLWEPARKQGTHIALNCCTENTPYPTTPHYFSTRLYDLDCVFSRSHTSTTTEKEQHYEDISPKEGVLAYKRITIHNNLISSFLLLGTREDATRKRGRLLHKLLSEQRDISSIHDRLLDDGFDLAQWMRKFEPPSIFQSFGNKEIHNTPIQTTPPTLTLVSTQSQRTIPFSSSLSIGRNGTLQPQANECHSGNPEKISSNHARIFWDGRRYLLEDLQSRNGTFLNNKRLDKPKPLRPHDHISFFDSLWLLQVPETSSTPIQKTPQQTIFGMASHTLHAPHIHHDQPWIVEWRSYSKQIDTQWLTIGRHPSCDICIDDELISGRHAELSMHGADLYVRDLGSQNGTKVNNILITQPRKIKSSDMIILGSTMLLIMKMRSPHAAPQVSPQPTSNSASSIVILSNDGAPPYTLPESIHLIVGRDPARAKWILKDESVSGVHCEIFHTDGTVYVQDLGSRNGSQLNGTTLSKQFLPWDSRASLQLGSTCLLQWRKSP